MACEGTVAQGLSASDLEQIFNEQVAASRENGGQRIERTVTYVGVHCNQTLTRIPQNAREISFAIMPQPDDPSVLHDDVVFSLILAQGSLNDVSLDVPFNSTVDPAEIFTTAEASGFGINLVPPADLADLNAYIGIIKQYGRMWLQSEQSNIRVAPIDGFIEYLLGAAAGYLPSQISTDPMITTLFTNAMPEESMNKVKVAIEELVKEALGENGISDLVDNTAKAIYLKDVQFRTARASMIEEELDTRTPMPNLIRLVSQHTDLSIVNSAGMIYELLTGFMGVLHKYLPGQEPAGIQTEVKGAASQTDAAVAETEAKAPEPLDKLADVICKSIGAMLGGNAQLRNAWSVVENQTHVTRRIDLQRGVVAPAAGALAMATAIESDPKVTALALAELALLFGAVLETGGAIDPIQQQQSEPVVPAGKVSNIIAVG